MLFAFYRWSKESQILLEHADGKKIKTLRTYIFEMEAAKVIKNDPQFTKFI